MNNNKKTRRYVALLAEHMSCLGNTGRNPPFGVSDGNLLTTPPGQLRGGKQAEETLWVTIAHMHVATRRFGSCLSGRSSSKTLGEQRTPDMAYFRWVLPTPS